MVVGHNPRTRSARLRVWLATVALTCGTGLLFSSQAVAACAPDGCAPLVLPSDPVSGQARPSARQKRKPAMVRASAVPLAPEGTADVAPAPEPTPSEKVASAEVIAPRGDEASATPEAPLRSPKGKLRKAVAPPPAAGPPVLADRAAAAEPSPAVASAIPADAQDQTSTTRPARDLKANISKAAVSKAGPDKTVLTTPIEGGTGIAGFKTDLEGMKPLEIKVSPRAGVPTTLAAAVRTAIADNALIKVSEGSALDALAGIDVASVGLYPQVDGRLAGGASATGDWQQTRNYAYFNRKNAYGAGRGDASLSAQQILFDFGATRSGIAKAAAFTEAQNFSVLQTIEDVAFKTADAYLKVLQERDLVALASENLDSLKEIADLVSENQKNGNGTIADVKRVGARVIDAASGQADETLALKLASDQLRRLIRVDPSRLGPAPSLSGVLPADETRALTIAETTNPGILAYRASMQSREAEIASIKGGRMPKLTAEISASNRQYQAVNDKTQFDGTALLGLSYKFYDGGLASAQIEQVRARMLQDEMRMRDARETIESDLRQNYFTMKISRDKSRSLAEGVDLNAKARTLYREQFRGGKRSLLELLEVQQAYFLARRTQITNQFDERRASYLILRSLGRFAVAALRTR